jgi:glycosidase
MRFLENHDQPRIAGIFSSPSMLKNWTAFYLLLPGASLIYAGQELGISHLPELFEKDPILWENGDKEFCDFFKKMVAITKEIKGTCEDFSVMELARGVVKIEWVSETEEYVALLNLEDKYGKVELLDILQGKELLTDQEMDLSDMYTLEKEPLIIQRNESIFF